MPTALNIETREALYIRAGITPGFVVGGRSFVNAGTTLEDWDFVLFITGAIDPSLYTFDGVDTVTMNDVSYSIGVDERWTFVFQPRPAQTPVFTDAVVQYTNGFDVTKVLQSLIGRIRWRQPTRSDFPFSLSGINVWPADDFFSPVFESTHKIVNPYNVWVTQDDKDIDEDGFNLYLTRMSIDLTLKVLKKVFDKGERLEKKLLFERFGRQDYVNMNEGKFVGVRIICGRAFDKSIQVDSVALKFDSDVTFNMYLFHDTQPGQPLTSLSVTAHAGQQNVVPINKIISYAGAQNKSGVYYFGYFQNDLGGAKAINEIIERFNTSYNFGCTPCEMPQPTPGAIDVNNVSFTVKSHGFNIQMSAFRDFTQLIIQCPHLFDNLIQQQMAADVIELIQNNTRTSKDQRISAELTKQLYVDLNQAIATNEVPIVPGLKSSITKEYARVKKEFYPDPKKTSITHDTDNIIIYGTYNDATINYDI